MRYYLEVMDKQWCRAECLNALIKTGGPVQKWLQMCMYAQSKSEQYKTSVRIVVEKEEVLFKISHVKKKKNK